MSELQRTVGLADPLATQQIFDILESSKGLTDSILDGLASALIMVDENLKILKLNASAQELFGQSESKALGKNATEFLPQLSPLRTLVEEDVERPASERSFECEIPLKGVQRYIHWQVGSGFSDRQRNRRIFVCIGNDTTDARTALEAMLSLRRDLSDGNTAQSLLLPDSRIVSGPFFDAAGFYMPATIVGGDMWRHGMIPGVGWLTVVADVTGHGVGAAMVASAFAGALTMALHEYNAEAEGGLQAALIRLHEVMGAMFREQYVVSFGAALIHEKKHKATLVRGGFPKFRLLTRDGKSGDHGQSSNPLGFLGITCQPALTDIDFLPGDRLICFSDGCYENSPGGPNRGKKHLYELFERSRKLRPAEACKEVGLGLEKLSVGQAPDDVTFVICDRG